MTQANFWIIYVKQSITKYTTFLDKYLSLLTSGSNDRKIQYNKLNLGRQKNTKTELVMDDGSVRSNSRYSVKAQAYVVFLFSINMHSCNIESLDNHVQSIARRVKPVIKY